MKLKILLAGIILQVCNLAEAQYPADVQAAIKETQSNKAELQKALDYFYKEGDSVKIKCIDFLVANMPVHFSANYYWVDGSGKRISFNEMDYPTFTDAQIAFASLQSKAGKLRAVAYTYRDIDSIKSDMLVENVDLAVDKLRSNKGNFNTAFLEYILPYRTSFEPLQEWRKIYASRFNGIMSGRNPSDTEVLNVGKNINRWFTNSYSIEGRREPLPRLGAVQLLNRHNGACEDIADLAAFMLRSQGYAATVDFVPAWATASGLHFLNYVDVVSIRNHHFDAADAAWVDTLTREPSKVLRTTYSIQRKSLAAQLNDTSSIPNNFMRLKNYKDVTSEYWKTSDVNVRLFRVKDFVPKVAFVAVWNFGKWKPVWYSAGLKNDSATFTNMCLGSVYLPVFYLKHHTVPAGWPVINGYNYKMVLQPNFLKKRKVVIPEQAKYLAFRAGKKYTLNYWNNHWVPVGTGVPAGSPLRLQFENVPDNALLLLVPEYSQKKARPFIISENGERSWF